MTRRYSVRIEVFSGTFASQPLAFARLLDAADRAGGFVDLDDVDVIRHAHEVRLAHYFRPAVAATVLDLMGTDDTLILLKPKPGEALVRLSVVDPLLRRLGGFPGTILWAGYETDA